MFCVYNEDDRKLYKKKMDKFFPVVENSVSKLALEKQKLVMKQLRDRLNLNQEDVAAISEVSQSNLNTL